MTTQRQVRQILTICVVGVLAVGLVGGSPTVAATSAPAGESATVTTVTSDSAPVENETTPHKNPETVSEAGDSDRVAAYLSDRLSGLLGASSQNISAGQYEQARALLGDEYNETLSQYIEVTGDTDQGTAAEAFESARDDAAQLSTLRTEFEETRQAYETAVDNGERERARRLARELATLAEQIDDVAVQLNTQLNEVENTTGTDLNSTQTSISTVQNATTETATVITATEFTATELTATATPPTVSYAAPTTVTGTLHTTAGEAIRNESVTLQIGGSEVTTKTNAMGQFSVAYQPIALPLNATTVPVAFVPGDVSPYRAANTTATVQVSEQATSTVSLTTTQVSTSPGQSIPISGTVTIGANSTTAGVPVVLERAGQQIGTAETTANGSFTVEGAVPVETAQGVTPYSIRVPLTDAAVSGSTATLNVSVTDAATTLTLATNITGTSSPVVGVSGSLTLASGESVPGQAISIFVGETQVDTTTTDAAGRYEATIPTTAFDSYESNPTIRVAFTESDAALAESRAETTTTLPPAFTTTENGVQQFFEQPGQLLIVVGLIGGLVLGSIAVARTAGLAVPWRPASSDAVTETATDTTAAASTTAASSDSPTRAQTLLAHAEQSLATDETATAVQSAYASLRLALAPTVPDSRADTHWEFYDRCKEANIEPLDEAETVTTAYEEAMFAPITISPERAQQVVEAVATVVEQTETTQSPGSD